MKEIQRRKVRNNTEKPFPGCLGRMVNLFDLSAGVNRNKLLTDKPHRDGDYPLYFLPTHVSYYSLLIVFQIYIISFLKVWLSATIANLLVKGWIFILNLGFLCTCVNVKLDCLFKWWFLVNLVAPYVLVKFQTLKLNWSGICTVYWLFSILWSLTHDIKLAD